MKLYHELAEYYFAIENAHRDISKDASFISKIKSNFTFPSLLDLGCGTGEHLHHFNSMNIRCTGIDNSEDMLRIARERFPGSAEFLNRDMRNFDYFEEFDIVTCLFGSLDYITDDEEVHKVLWNTWRALKPGGTGVFEIWNALPIIKIKKKDLDLVSDTNIGSTRIERERGFLLMENSKCTIVEVNYRYTLYGNSVSQSIRDRHIMRAYRRDEFEKFLTENGLNVIAVYSNSDMDPYRDTSNKIIFHFKKQ